MKTTRTQSAPFRIAVVWQSTSLQGQHVFNALYRQADLRPEVTLRHFDVLRVRFTPAVIRPLLEWRPHGVIVRMASFHDLEMLRHRLAGVPLVATSVMPPSLADTQVVVDLADAVAVALDHFRTRGLSHLALFCGAPELLAAERIRPFLDAVPEGHVLNLPLRQAVGKPVRCARWPARHLHEWLRALPRPVGLLTLENSAAPFLCEVCRELGLRIPRDVQLIGVDDADECLACDPHLTGLDLPGARIGEAALETMLARLRHTLPPPPPVIRVGGCGLTARNSTGPVPAGAPQVAAALRFIQAHAKERVSAARLVTVARVGHTTFYEKFRAATGETPARHLRRLRLEQACRLLRETAADIQAVAETCGFRSPHYFSRFLRRETGLTPTAYRNLE